MVHDQVRLINIIKMKININRGVLATTIILLVVIIDQIIKISIKTNMTLGESIDVASWCKILFIENRGMAWGMEVMPQMFLTIFRIIASGALAYGIYKSIKLKVKKGFLICISLILAGALGNIVDNIFYGAIFTESTPFQVSTFTVIGEGYGGWFHGRVVDMFYFPIIDTNWPEWMPFVGGEHFIFFSPVFNFADSAISCGVIAIILFYSRYLNNLLNGKK